LLWHTDLQFTHEGTQGQSIGDTNGTYLDLHEVQITSTPVKGGFRGVIHSTSTRRELRFALEFEPPITVRLEVVMPNGWHFHQMHYCIPIAPGKTRMLLRSMRDWLLFLPDKLILYSNLRILNQDKCVLYGQKLRLDQGASRWNYPVKGDALAIRYRRWRDTVEPRSRPWFKGYTGSSFKKGGGVKRGTLEQEGEIEELPSCRGACDRNLDTIDAICHEAPALWPSGNVYKERVAASTVLRRIGVVLYYAGYVFSVVVAALYLSNQY